jgi:hypothetical protein
MMLYVIWGIEFHGCRELLGIYDNEINAIYRKIEVKELNLHDDVIIQQVLLNENLEYLI